MTRGICTNHDIGLERIGTRIGTAYVYNMFKQIGASFQSGKSVPEARLSETSGAILRNNAESCLALLYRGVSAIPNHYTVKIYAKMAAIFVRQSTRSIVDLVAGLLKMKNN